MLILGKICCPSGTIPTTKYPLIFNGLFPEVISWPKVYIFLKKNNWIKTGLTTIKNI